MNVLVLLFSSGMEPGPGVMEGQSIGGIGAFLALVLLPTLIAALGWVVGWSARREYEVTHQLCHQPAHASAA